LDRKRQVSGSSDTLAVRSGHSRIPVIGENVDDIVGWLPERPCPADVLVARRRQRHQGVAVMRPAVFVPDSKPLDALLRECSATATHGSAG